MHIPTIYSEEFDGSTNFVISRDKLHHLVNVLRIKKGNEVKVSNGQGLLAQGILNENQSIVINNIEELSRERDINFFLANIDSVSRMRFVIEKLTELGVNSICVGNTIRSGVKNFQIEKMKFWAKSAVEQSGNPFIPKIYKVKSLDYDKFSSCLDINGERNLNKMISANIAIGPEGGWDPSELKQFKTLYSLGFTTLRTETAAIVAATLLLNA